MACFLVPAAEAVITTTAEKLIESKEKKAMTGNSEASCTDISKPEKITFSGKLKWLNRLLWGGSFLLMFEHVWHGEVVPYFPFLTAASNSEDAAAMLSEMSTVGVTMAVLVTAVWGVMVLVSNRIEKSADNVAEPALSDEAL